MSNLIEPLHRLAESYGVQTSYYDDQGGFHEAGVEALSAALHVLGAPLHRLEDAPDAQRARLLTLWRRPLEPVQVAWDGYPGDLTLRLPAAVEGPLDFRLELESGVVHEWTQPARDLPAFDQMDDPDGRYVARRLRLIGPFPLGYHTLRVEGSGILGECLIVAAPRRAYAGEDGPHPTWGGFLPVYAVRSQRNWGAGDFTDLENLIQWVQDHGGGLVGTLPLLAAFLDEPFEPSPYSPASRLFWNEMFLDMDRLPEAPAPVRNFLGSDEFRREIARLRDVPLVDYRGLMALKRRVLAPTAEAFFQGPAERQAEFNRFIAAHPRAEDYAAFRAAGERHRTTWWNWPDAARGGVLIPGDYDEADRRYHLFVQWQADAQLRRLAQKARAQGPGLYLDLPLGVHSDSYDVWRERSSFALGASGGAPPDSFFTKGQDWGFPPLHPENARKGGYRYFREVLAHHMRLAGVLRLDHIMGLHRLYWVPHGLGAKHGVYVRYPVDELYAVLLLESNRNKTTLVGEDLGTVPEYVRPTMAEHNVHRLYVGQYEAQPDPDRPLPTPSRGAVASLNTHDMPTFAGYWRSLDLADRQALGLLDEAGVHAEEHRRESTRANIINRLRLAGLLGTERDATSVLRAWLKALAESEAGVVLANLEDLWEAEDPQNVPGTWHERPNWSRKAAHSLGSFDAVPGLLETLRLLDETIKKRQSRR
jgi:4-alpha-glucanotransferase